MQFSIRQILGLMTAVAVALGTWYIWTGPERAAATIRDLGGEADWVTESGLTNKDVRALPWTERYSRVVIGADWRGGLKGLCLLGSVRRLRELEISNPPEAPTVLDFDFISLDGLRVFDVEGLSVPAEFGPRLSTMRFLEKASFVDCRLSAEIISVATELPRLRTLTLDGSRVSGLIGKARASALSAVYLRGATIDDNGIGWLANLTSAETIVLSDTDVGDLELFRLSSLPRLTTISVARTNVTTRGIEEFRKRAACGHCFIYYGQDLSNGALRGAE